MRNKGSTVFWEEAAALRRSGLTFPGLSPVFDGPFPGARGSVIRAGLMGNGQGLHGVDPSVDPMAAASSSLTENDPCVSPTTGRDRLRHGQDFLDVMTIEQPVC